MNRFEQRNMVFDVLLRKVKQPPREWKVLSGVEDEQYYDWSILTIKYLWIWSVVALVPLLPLCNIYGLVAMYMAAKRFALYDVEHDESRSIRLKEWLCATVLTGLILDWSSGLIMLFITMHHFATVAKVGLFIAGRRYHVIRFKNGMLLPVKYQGRVRTVTDPREVDDNDCGWYTLFDEPELVRDLLGTLTSGKMPADLVREFVDDGLIKVWIDGQLYESDHCAAAMDVTLSSGHMSKGPGIMSTKTDNWYSGPDFGVPLPRRLPVRTTGTVDRLSMIEECKYFLSRVNEPTAAGRMAEAAYIATREELDILSELESKPELNKLAYREVLGAYLSNDKWHVYDYKEQSWLANSKLPKDRLGSSTLGWDGNRFVLANWFGRNIKSIEYADSGEPCRVRYILFMEDMPYRRGVSYAARCRALIDLTHSCASSVEEGVPSCGKTTSMIKNYSPTALFACPGKESVDELVKKGYPARTLDSLISEGWSGGLITHLYVDEGLMAHCGAIEMVVQMTTPTNLKIYGDSNQIPYICRVNGYTLRHPEYVCSDEPTYNIEAWRNPKAVCDMLRPLYSKGYNWANDIVGEVTASMVSSIEGIRSGYDVYLPFLKADKSVLKNHVPTSKVMTIHESQGGRWSKVAICRLKSNDVPVFDSIPHMIVGLSRTWDKVHYFTTKPDQLYVWIMSQKLAEKTKVKVPVVDETKYVPKRYKHFGGGMTLLIKTLVKLTAPQMEDDYNKWRSKISHIIPHNSTFCAPWIVERPLYKCRWIDTPTNMPSIQTLQLTLDGMYHRRDDDVAKVVRMDWPVQWPKGFMVDLKKSSKKPVFESRAAVHPKLATPQPPRVLNHPADRREAFTKRVVDPPKLKLDYGPERAQTLADGMMRNVDTQKLKALNLHMNENCEQAEKQWWALKNERKKKAVLASKPLVTPGATYQCMPKGDPKPSTDGKHMDGITGGQLITQHADLWTSVFAPIFKTVLIKVLSCMNANIVVNSLMSYEALSGKIDHLLSGKEFANLELDVGKYDKSQDGVMLEAQCLVLLAFGMSDCMVEIWRQFHEICKLKDSKAGVTYTVGFERRTGDSLTWLGNTIVLIMLMAHLYRIEEAFMVLVGGDDNVAAFPLSMDITDTSRKAAEELNFELKILLTDSSMYFCSRFIVLTRFGWVTVADPVKIIIRLGRNDIQGREHLRKLHESFTDLHYMYKDPEVRRLVTMAATDRYKLLLGKDMPNISYFVEAIAKMVVSYSELENLFTGTKEEWDLKLDPFEKVGSSYYQPAENLFNNDW